MLALAHNQRLMAFRARFRSGEVFATRITLMWPPTRLFEVVLSAHLVRHGCRDLSGGPRAEAENGGNQKD